MRRLPRLAAVMLACLALALALPAPARAQADVPEMATLVADRVEIRGDSQLVAEGNVEVLWRSSRLRATRIRYDGSADRLVIEGPITLTQGSEVAIFASEAELSTDLQDGLLRSARLVLSRQFQLAAVQIARVDGRYTELSKVVASSCQVCAESPVPLWEIRARRVVHDTLERQIYFDGAQFRVMGLPVAYIPRLRLPDPTLKRANGVLFPDIRSTSDLGAGLKLPYFIAIGRSADLTVTPYVSPATRTLELRYRQAFRRGAVTFEGAVSRDDLRPGETRGYLVGEGRFVLPRDFTLSFGIEAASDRAYLLDYGYSDADRLQSGLALARTRRDEDIRADLLHARTLRDGEDNATLPSVIGLARYERRFVPGAIGGVATLGFGALTASRSSGADGDGRDVARATASLGWERSEVFGPGLVATATARATAEFRAVAQDSAFGPHDARLVPEAAIALRWPLAKIGARGASHVLEPMAMLGWSRVPSGAVPNEDSTSIEFDEANLLALSRFAGLDAREDGLRLALGLAWTRVDPEGRSLRLSFGRILRADADPAFAPGSGLDGTRSDWLLAARVDLPSRLSLTARALVDDDLSLSKGDLRLGYTGSRFDVTTGLLFLAAAPEEARPEEIGEWSLDTTWRIDPNWQASTGWRYDIVAERATSAGIGLGFRNECVRVDLSLSRRFTSSTSVTPTTDFGLSVELTGFGTGGEGGAARRRCIN